MIETLGYRNEEYFYRQFRKQEGRSFAEYRRQLTERRKEA
ncbi:AraC family transcriptional regulator [Neglectibacter timonensis]